MNFQKGYDNLMEFIVSPENKVTFDQTRFPDIFVQAGQKHLLIPFGTKKMSIIHDYEKLYSKFDFLSDTWSEKQRLSCEKAGRVVMDDWESGRFDYLTRDLISTEDLRDEIFKNSNECTQFKVSMTVTMITKVLAPGKIGRRWLDISAGWGDRLIAAIALNNLGIISRYVAFDPNLALELPHSEIKRDLKSFDKFATIIYKKFEDSENDLFEICKRDGKLFDFVFTSPPFFNLEIYSESQRQNSLEEWFSEFLIKSILLAEKFIRMGGFIALHLADTGRERYVTDMINMINRKSPSLIYQGLVVSRDISPNSKQRPIWIFQKVPFKI